MAARVPRLRKVGVDGDRTDDVAGHEQLQPEKDGPPEILAVTGKVGMAAAGHC